MEIVESKINENISTNNPDCTTEPMDTTEVNLCKLQTNKDESTEQTNKNESTEEKSSETLQDCTIRHENDSLSIVTVDEKETINKINDNVPSHTKEIYKSDIDINSEESAGHKNILESQYNGIQIEEIQHVATRDDEIQHIETTGEEIQYIDTKRDEIQHIETKDDEIRHIEMKTVETQNIETTGDEIEHIEPKCDETQHIDTKRIEMQHVESKSDDIQNNVPDDTETQKFETIDSAALHTEILNSETEIVRSSCKDEVVMDVDEVTEIKTNKEIHESKTSPMNIANMSVETSQDKVTEMASSTDMNTNIIDTDVERNEIIHINDDNINKSECVEISTDLEEVPDSSK